MELVKRGASRIRAAHTSQRNAYTMPAAATRKRGRELVSSMARNTYAPAMPSRALLAPGRGCRPGQEIQLPETRRRVSIQSLAEGGGQRSASGCSSASILNSVVSQSRFGFVQTPLQRCDVLFNRTQALREPVDIFREIVHGSSPVLSRGTAVSRQPLAGAGFSRAMEAGA